MRAREFIREDASVAATSAGSIAAVPYAIGTILRKPNNTEPGKYKNSIASDQGKKNNHVIKRSQNTVSY